MRPAGFAAPGEDVPLAPWWPRALGAVADAVVVGLVTYAVASFSGLKSRDGYFFLDLGIRFVYSFAMLVTWGHTLGMALLRLQAVDAVAGETPIRPHRAALRSLIGGVLTIVPLGAILDLAWPLWDARNQTLHDKAAGTVVLRTLAPAL